MFRNRALPCLGGVGFRLVSVCYFSDIHRCCSFVRSAAALTQIETAKQGAETLPATLIKTTALELQSQCASKLDVLFGVD